MVYCKNAYLTKEEMTVNAQYILDYLTNRGWTENAVCGMLGNMETESTINPGIWQSLDQGNTSLGFGLVQWTPATKYIDWAQSNGYPNHDDWYAMVPELERIIWEVENGVQFYPTDEYPMTFADFIKSSESPVYLADVFITNYERPADSDQPIRGEQAQYWFDRLEPGGNPEPCIQLAQFPMDVINITQGENGGYSHAGTLAIDFVGFTTDYPYYAPVDCECILRLDSDALLAWKSLTKVMCVDGVKRNLMWRCIHDNVLDFNVGDTLQKGEHMGDSGDGGNATGDHFHLDVFEATSYDKSNPLHIYNVFATNGVQIVEGLGYPWKESDYQDCSDDGGNPNPPNKKGDALIYLSLSDAIRLWN